MNTKLLRGTKQKAVSANSQGRRMLQNDRENLELERLQNEIRKLVVERLKLMAEERKFKREKFWYPVAVGTGVLTAIAAVFSLLAKL
jgi:hypothetical protein